MIGITGDVWEIAEPDPVEELKQAVLEKKDVLQAYINREKKLNRYEPSQGTVTVPPARKAESYMVSTIYTLDHDITDASGAVIYPAGFRYNILDYQPFPLKYKYVIFNGADEAEIAFVFKRFGKDPDVRFLVTQGTGAWLKTVRKTGGDYEVKFLTREMADILHVRATVSAAYQVGNRLKVDVIPVPEKAESPASYQHLQKEN
jgi:hypothetical protein